MPKPYSDDLRGRVVAAMDSGEGCWVVGARFGVAPSTAGNWYRAYRATGSYAPKAMGGDHRSKLKGEEERIKALLKATPDLTLEDVRHDLAARGVLVGYATVWRMVHGLRLSFKKNVVCDGTRPA